jgi:hypothetical protein
MQKHARLDAKSGNLFLFYGAYTELPVPILGTLKIIWLITWFRATDIRPAIFFPITQESSTQGKVIKLRRPAKFQIIANAEKRGRIRLFKCREKGPDTII